MTGFTCNDIFKMDSLPSRIYQKLTGYSRKQFKYLKIDTKHTEFH
jgi:hypothetical protein